MMLFGLTFKKQNLQVLNLIGRSAYLNEQSLNFTLKVSFELLN